MRIYILGVIVVIGSLLCAVPGLCEQQHRIDYEYKVCIDQEQTAAGMVVCAELSAQAWTEEVVKMYLLLLEQMDESEREKLKVSQEAWVRFREAESVSMEQVLSSRRGALYATIGAGNRVEIARQRALALKKLYDIYSIMNISGGELR